MDLKELETKALALDSKATEIEAKEKALEAKLVETENLKKELEVEKTNLILNKTQGVKNMSLEQKTLAAFGAGHVKNLLNVNTADERFNRVPDECKQVVSNLKKQIDTARWIAQMFYGGAKDSMQSEDGVANIKNIFDTKYAKETDLANRLKAFGSTVAGGGDEWVPTAISSTYIDEYLLALEVAGKFREISMPTNPYELPIAKDNPKARKIAEGSAITGAQFSTDKLTFSAIKSAEYFEIPEELNEDSAPAFLDYAKTSVVEAQYKAMEAAIINGATGVHIDSDTAALGADVAEKFWNGLRKLAIVNSATTNFGSGVTATKLDEMRKTMGKFGVNVKELAWLVSPNAWNQMLGLTEVSTVDKFGSMATVLSGALAAFRGIPIIISEHMRDDLNASGVYDGITTDNTGVLLFNHRRFYIGRRRPIKVKIGMDANIAYDRWLMASYQRLDFKGMVQSATEKSVVYGINVTV